MQNNLAGSSIRKQNKIQTITAVVLINILLAVVAFMKDMALASYFGTTEAADAFAIAFFIPDTIGNNIVASAIGISCIPIFSSLYAARKFGLLKAYFFKINLYTLVFACGAALFILMLDDTVIRLLGSSFSEEIGRLSLLGLHIMLFTIPLYPVVFIGVSMLQVEGRFVYSSFAPVLYNVVFFTGIILCIIFRFHTALAVEHISVSVLISVSSMLVFVYAALYKENAKSCRNEQKWTFKEMFTKTLGMSEFRKIAVSYGGILFLMQATLYIERLLALNYTTGGVSSLNYAYRLAQLPVWVLAAAIGTVILPMMSRAIVEKKNAEQILWQSIGTMLTAIMPAALTLYILRVPIISLLFMHGAFNQESLGMTAEVLSSYSLAILGQGVVILCLRYFISIKKTGRPFMLFLLSSLLNVALDYYLVGRMGLVGLGYGAAVGASLSALLCLYDTGFRLRFFYEAAKGVYKKLLYANGMIGILALFYLYIWNKYFRLYGGMGRGLYVIMAAGAFSIGYFYYLRHLKVI